MNGAKNISADKQRENSAKAKTTARPRGKAFEKENPYTWKPGKSGNPKGRPKGRTISDSLRQLLSEDHVSEHTVADAVAEKLVEKALDGSIEAIKEIADRTEGKPSQRTVIAGDPDNPLNLNADLDLTKLSDEEFALLGRLIAQASSIGVGDGTAQEGEAEMQ